MKPIVGVIPLWDEEKESFWMLPGYMEGLMEAGALPVMFPLTDTEFDLSSLMSICKGVLFTGGHDVSPGLYGEEPLNELVSCCPARDRMESIILDIAIRQDKSLLGICRGLQFINAALGGTLYQDLPIQHPSPINHHQNPPYDHPVHKVRLREESPMYNLFQEETISVNSYHHQAIKTLAPSLRIMAESIDGLIEAVYMPEKRFLWAIQWHPEFNFRTSRESRKIFEAFIASMQ